MVRIPALFIGEWECFPCSWMSPLLADPGAPRQENRHRFFAGEVPFPRATQALPGIYGHRGMAPLAPGHAMHALSLLRGHCPPGIARGACFCPQWLADLPLVCLA